VTYEVTWSRQAKRALSSELPEAVAAACVEFVLGPLAGAPHRVGKPLREPQQGLYSARRGEFRVIYRIDGARIVVHVVTIRHRRDVYRHD
jgi:mRNA-degrading endonuclease RelE of RelBE toxin-antitoxin system